MIIKWDIISKVDPKTRVVRYTLIIDGTEADARMMAKKLGKCVLAIKRALRPYVYAFRLPNDLDETTLDKIRTGVRDVVQQTEKSKQFLPGGAAADPLFNADPTPITMTKARAVKETPAPQKEEINLEEATIISKNRILGKEETPQSKPPLPPSSIPAAAPQINSIGDMIVPLGGKKEEDALPDVEPDQTRADFGLKRWIHHKKEQPKQEKPEVRQPAPASSIEMPRIEFDMDPLPDDGVHPIGESQPEREPQPQPVAEPTVAPQPTAEPKETPHDTLELFGERQEKRKKTPAKQPEPKPAVKPAKKISLSLGGQEPSKPPVKKPEPASDGFPQIHVQVRPATFEDEQPPATAETPKANSMPEKVSGPVPIPQKTKQQPETAAPSLNLEPPAREGQPDGIIPPPKDMPELTPAPVPEQVLNSLPEQASDKKDAAGPEIPRQPLNFSLEDMFLAETKYDMFVDVGNNNAQQPSGAQPPKGGPSSKKPEGTDPKKKNP